MNITETADVSLHRSQDKHYNLKQWPVVVCVCVCVCKRGGAQRVSDTELRRNYEIGNKSQILPAIHRNSFIEILYGSIQNRLSVKS